MPKNECGRPECCHSRTCVVHKDTCPLIYDPKKKEGKK